MNSHSQSQPKSESVEERQKEEKRFPFQKQSALVRLELEYRNVRRFFPSKSNHDIDDGDEGEKRNRTKRENDKNLIMISIRCKNVNLLFAHIVYTERQFFFRRRYQAIIF